MALRGWRVTAALSADASGPGKAPGGVLAMAAHIAMPERPNGGRVPRQAGERLAGTSDVCRGGRCRVLSFMRLAKLLAR